MVALALGALAVVAIAPGVFAPMDPNRIDLAHRLVGPSAGNWLGTDQFGRDLYSRLVYGAHATLGASLIVLTTTFGLSALAALAATLGSRPLRLLFGRLIELFLALPQLILAFAIVGVLGPGFFNTLVALTVTGWAGEARVLRGLLAAEVQAPYVHAARALGASPVHIAARHVVPAIAGRAAIITSLRLGHTILAISALSFLGLGVQPPTAEWGAMLGEAEPYIFSDPALMILPGLAVVATVAASNLLADLASNVLDVRG